MRPAAPSNTFVSYFSAEMQTLLCILYLLASASSIPLIFRSKCLHGNGTYSFSNDSRSWLFSKIQFFILISFKYQILDDLDWLTAEKDIFCYQTNTNFSLFQYSKFGCSDAVCLSVKYVLENSITARDFEPQMTQTTFLTSSAQIQEDACEQKMKLENCWKLLRSELLYQPDSGEPINSNRTQFLQTDQNIHGRLLGCTYFVRQIVTGKYNFENVNYF